ncbi:MAG TPA: DUF3014 domain-containing protein, partial [Gammaproteobacteria bacterium]
VPGPSEPPESALAPEQTPAEADMQDETEGVREPLPPLNESTGAVTDVLTGMFGADALSALFNSDEFVRRFVVTVDNLSSPKLPRQNLLFKRVAGPFAVTGEGDQRVIALENAARYAPYVELATRVETQRLVNIYERFYPLFQEAYAELGAPDAYFNDRVVEVIDHLLDTPVVAEPIPVVQPKVFYLYADPGLEALSAGQKILLRMGSANAERIKSKLRDLRAALTRGARGQDGDERPMVDPEATSLRPE